MIMESQYLIKRRQLKQGVIEKDPPKAKQPLRSVGLKRQEEKKDGGNPDKKRLSNWYAQIGMEELGYCKCWECGKHVPNGFIRCATAHILPKKGFPSVATHPLNYLILSASCCHDKSHKVETFRKMKIFGEAVDRFLQFERLLTKEEKAKKYYTLFREAAIKAFPEKF